ncbi:MAG: hypothetical protein WC825_08245 [Gallionellaceae bacterium]
MDMIEITTMKNNQAGLGGTAPWGSACVGVLEELLAIVAPL